MNRFRFYYELFTDIFSSLQLYATTKRILMKYSKLRISLQHLTGLRLAFLSFIYFNQNGTPYC